MGQSLATGQTFKSNSFYSLVSLVLKVTIAFEDHLPLWLVEILWKRKLKFASQSLFLRRLAEVFSSHRVLSLVSLEKCLQTRNPDASQCNPLPSKAKTPSGDPYSSNLFLKVADQFSSLQFWACQVPQTPSLTGMATASSYGQMGALTKAGMGETNDFISRDPPNVALSVDIKCIRLKGSHRWWLVFNARSHGCNCMNLTIQRLKVGSNMKANWFSH